MTSEISLRVLNKVKGDGWKWFFQRFFFSFRGFLGGGNGNMIAFMGVLSFFV